MELAKSQLIKPTFSIFDFPSPLYPWSVYVVVNFLSQIIFVFLLFLGVVMYANEVETKEKEKLPEVKILIATYIHLTIIPVTAYQCKAGGGGGRAWGGDLTFFKNLPSNSLPTGKSFQSGADSCSSQMQPDLSTPGSTLLPNIPRQNPRKAQWKYL